MTKIHLLLFSILLSFHAFSQNQLNGKVFDQSTKQPIPNVNIQIYGTLQGTVSDADGKFNLTYSQNGIVLSFSSIGYEKKLFQLNEIPKQETVFYLTQKIDTLQDAVVSAKKGKRSKYISHTLTDFNFYGDNILALSYIGNSPYLVLLNPAMDTLSKISIQKNPNMIFHDCLGNNHVLYDTTAYQIFYDREGLKLIYPVGITTFQSYLLPCVGQDEFNLYFKKIYGSEGNPNLNWFPVEARDSVMDYYIVNKRNKTKSELTTVANERTIEVNEPLVALVEEKEKAGLYIPPQTDPKTGNESNRNETRRRNVSDQRYISPYQKQFDYLFAQQVLYKKIYAPLFVVSDTVYIFNYENSKIQCYYYGQLFDEINITFHKDRNCEREMLIDRKNNRIYAVFQTNGGMKQLKEINLYDGKIIHSYDIPDQYADKISIYDNCIYYLRKKDNYYYEAELVRMKIN